MTEIKLASEESDVQWFYVGIEDGWHVWQRYDKEGDPIEGRYVPVKDAPEDFVPTDDPPIDAWEDAN